MVYQFFKILFMAGIVVQEVIRFPHRRRYWREKTQQGTKASHVSQQEWIVSILGFLGMQIIPLVSILTPALDALTYQVPLWMGWLGIPLERVTHCG
ncbi:hypothetical protein KSC_072950 [Ktedonobacter sp. SOSP1-52]|uniref:hypothetical protein n=1 Tax=Ktedonobacter sp. SOSP1-52 TaxID=2778366 RepID=UPI0019168501|nr:hypothetical protein [Ktedonobacter sp. SOSP1-52]GHO68403.1 hypothetical protein KSC_072950 [Ktedonobacter sp. SOSP1-52]